MTLDAVGLGVAVTVWALVCWRVRWHPLSPNGLAVLFSTVMLTVVVLLMVQMP